MLVIFLVICISMVSCVTVVYPLLTVGLAVPAELSTNLFLVPVFLPHLVHHLDSG